MTYDPQPSVMSSHNKPRVWLRRMGTDSFVPKLIDKRGQRLIAALDERIGRERPPGTAVYKFTHEPTRVLARETIADDIEYVLEKYGYDISLEEALGPRAGEP